MADSINATFDYPAHMSAFRGCPIVMLDGELAADPENGGDEIAFRYRSDKGDTVRQGRVLAIAPNYEWVKILTARSGNPATFRVDKMTSRIYLVNKAS